MNVPDGFVFVCESGTRDKIVASDVIRIECCKNNRKSFIVLHGLIDLYDFPVFIIFDHGHDDCEEFEKGTKEFNELLELCYVKQVLK